MNLLDKLYALLDKLLGVTKLDSFTKPTMEYTFLDWLILAATVYFGIKLIRYIAKITTDGFKKTKITMKKRSIKNKAKTTLCNTCGKTVDKCTCPDKRDYSNRKKLRLLKKEKKQRERRRKNKE